MSLFLKNFSTHAEYDTYINGSDAILPNVSICTTEGDVHYNPYVPHDYSQDYFTMVVTIGGNIIWSGSTIDNTLSYSKDNGETWNTADSGTAISVEAGDKVLWKGTPTPQVFEGIGKFSGATDVRYSVEGNAMSLLFGDNFIGKTSLSGKDSSFCNLFSGCTTVTSAENLSLPATILTDNCYQFMFSSCTSLTTAPKLPATTLANASYASMFQGCTSLTTAPVLSAITLANSCYTRMFQGCTNLTTAPSLPATTLANYCYNSMFRNCTNLTTAPSLPATTLANYCYQSMFQGCTSLTTAPELPATTLAQYCYYEMFSGCTSLSSIKCLATNISASNCTKTWVSGVAASGTFTKAASTDWSVKTGTSGIPSGWSVVDA